LLIAHTLDANFLTSIMWRAEFVLAVKRLLCNPIYMVTCLGACMELAIVSGFVVYLPKYLETQFSLGKSQASVFTGTFFFSHFTQFSHTLLRAGFFSLPPGRETRTSFGAKCSLWAAAAASMRALIFHRL
jgi:hypothetical protein